MAKGNLAALNDFVEERADLVFNGGVAFRILIGSLVGTISFYGKTSDLDTPFPIAVTQYNDGTTAVTSCNADFAGFINVVGLTSVLAKVTAYTSGTAVATVTNRQG